MGLKNDSTIVVWGCNDFGQCDVPEPNTNFIEIAAGSEYCLGLKNDGSIVCWGSNSGGQCNVPVPNQDFVAVSAGGGHSLGLKSDGSIVAWGWNYYGQCDVPEPNQDFVEVAAGRDHSLGLHALETGIEEDPFLPPSVFMNSPTPNPFSSSVSISFTLPNGSGTELAVYDVSGRLVVTLVEESMEAGEHSVVFDGTDLSEGIYLFRLTTETATCTERSVLIR